MEAKDAEEEYRQQRKEELELRGCTFAPNVNTNSGSNGDGNTTTESVHERLYKSATYSSSKKGTRDDDRDDGDETGDANDTIFGFGSTGRKANRVDSSAFLDGDSLFDGGDSNRRSPGSGQKDRSPKAKQNKKQNNGDGASGAVHNRLHNYAIEQKIRMAALREVYEDLLERQYQHQCPFQPTLGKQTNRKKSLVKRGRRRAGVDKPVIPNSAGI